MARHWKTQKGMGTGSGALAVLALVALLAPSAHAQNSVTVIDSRTLRVGGVTYRLYGIDGPDLGQTCTKKNGKDYPCGAIARTAMLDLVAGAKVVCRPARGGAVPAIKALTSVRPVAAWCSADGFDIGGNMVHTGWALADPQTAPARYRRIEARSREANRGLWRGAFERPWDWRSKAQPAPDGKGPARDDR